MVGDQIPGHDDVGATDLPERLQADVAVQPVPDLHRPMQNQLLIGVHHLAQVVADQDPHEQLLDRERSEDADERDRCDQPAVSERRSGNFAVMGRIPILHGPGISV